MKIPKIKPLPNPCNKIAFPTKKEANYKLQFIGKKYQKHKKPVRSYFCENCGMWHLTSKELGNKSAKAQIREWLAKNGVATTNLKFDNLVKEYNNHELPLSERLKQILESRDLKFLEFAKSN